MSQLLFYCNFFELKNFLMVKFFIKTLGKLGWFLIRKPLTFEKFSSSRVACEPLVLLVVIGGNGGNWLVVVFYQACPRA